jgi:NTE family protein
VIRRGLVLGAGGVLGLTWSACALRRLEATTGWDPRTAEILVGTSAGSVLATLLGAGVDTTALVASQRAPSADPALPPWPRGAPLSWSLVGHALRGAPLVALAGLAPAGREDAGRLCAPVDAAVAAGAWVPHPRCWVVAMDVADGRRVAFGRADAPRISARAATRASCAVPGWFAPVAIDGHRYVDGGVVSPTSADLLVGEGLDEVIVVSPMTSRRRVPARSVATWVERSMRVMMSRILEREVAALEAAGTRVIRLEPTAAELDAMGANFMDPRRRALVVDAWAS